MGNALGIPGRAGSVDDHGRKIFRNLLILRLVGICKHLRHEGIVYDQFRTCVSGCIGDPFFRIGGIHQYRSIAKEKAGCFCHDVEP